MRRKTKRPQGHSKGKKSRKRLIWELIMSLFGVGIGIALMKLSCSMGG